MTKKASKKQQSASKKPEKADVLRYLVDPSTSESKNRELIDEIKLNRLYADEAIVDALAAHGYTPFNGLAREARSIQALEEALLGNIKTISAQFSSRADELIHVLYALETVQRQRFGLPQWKVTTFTVEDRFPDGELYESAYDAVAALDHFLGYFGVVMKSLIEPRSPETAPKVRAEKIAGAAAHLSLSSDWQIFHEMRTFWAHGCTTVSEDGQEFDSSGSEQVVAFRISLSRLRSFRSIRRTDPLNETLIIDGTRLLPLKGFRSKRELVSCYMTTLQFYSRDLTEQIHGASLAEWLRAYTIVMELATETITARKDIKAPEDMLLRGKPIDFAKEFESRGGLNLKTSQNIVTHFTFGKTSKDLLDAPFVPFEDELFLLPSVAMFIEPAFSLESLLKSIKKEKVNHELNFIGNGFERNIKKDVSGAKIVARKVEHGTFDCDVAFVLDSVLFLCECKGKLIASDFWSYTKLEHFLTHEAVDQHTRTCDFFASNLQYVRGRLELPPDWQPKEIQRIIVTSAKLGRAIRKNGIIIVDENTFHAFFARRHLTTDKHKEAILDEPIDERLVGEPTAEKFVDFISTPRSVVLHERYLAVRELTLPSLDVSALIRDVECYGEVKMHLA